MVDTKVFGYPNGHSGVLERAAVSWCQRKYNFTFSESEIHYCPSMSFGLAIAIRAFTQPGGKVRRRPIYLPPSELTKPVTGRVCALMNPLKFVNGRYEVDFEDFERRAADPDGLFLFPLFRSPHKLLPDVFSAG